jgi:flagellar assembly factor FliW
MFIDTSRFGQIEIDAERIVRFKDGILGFPGRERFALIQTGPDPVFFWLQSVDDRALAFVVCDPLAFVPDYQAPVRQDDLEALEMAGIEDCQVLIIVNKHDGCLTGNLLGPLVIGARSLLARQLVLADKRYSTRHLLTRLEGAATREAAVARSA